ncbi:TPA: hypothetical protein DCZ16_02625 [Candidatus Peregrinibacteria bacterium]|nr:hypothetical protein [Candidatus Peregrinibacteria bacterium]
MKEKGPDLGRRWLFTAIPAVVVTSTAALAGARSAFAQGVSDVLDALCTDGKSIPAICEACDPSIDEEAKQNNFLNSSRSTAAFVELANYAPEFIDLSNRKLKCLYPGAGSHIAPLFMATQLMDNDQIDSAEFIYTEVDPRSQNWLELSAQYLPQFDEKFIYSEHHTEKNDDGVVDTIIFSITYRNKPIKITLKINDPKKIDWFEPEDLSRSNLLVLHDVFNGKSAVGPLFMMLKAFRAMKDKNIQSTAVTAEDLTNVLHPGERSFKTDFSRRFDLELLGKFQRSTHSYGHRKMIGDIEAGPNSFKNGVILKTYPQLMSLSLDEIQTLMEVSLVANNGHSDHDGTAFHRLEQHKNPLDNIELYSDETLAKIITNSPRIVNALRNINKPLHDAFVIRLIQAVAKLFHEIPDFIFKRCVNPDDGFQWLFSIIHFAEFIDPDKLQAIYPQVVQLENLLFQLQRNYYDKYEKIEEQLIQARDVDRDESTTDTFANQSYELRNDVLSPITDQAWEIAKSLGPMAESLMNEANL